jgi:PAS domain S-box-containing protein
MACNETTINSPEGATTPVSYEEYQSLFENMLNGFAYCKMIYDTNNKPIDFIYLQVNDAFQDLTGLKKTEITGKRVTEAIPGIAEDHPELFEIYGRVASSGKSEKFEVYFKPLKIWLFISVYSPKSGYFVAVFDNITEQKAAETSLRRSSERFMTLADCLPEIVFETDMTGKLTYVNQKAYELTGYTQQDFNRGVYNFDFFSQRDLPRAKENFSRALMTSTPTSNEYSFVKKDGTEFPAIIKGIPITFEGKTIGMRGLVIDVSEEKKTIDDLAGHVAACAESAQKIEELNDKLRVVGTLTRHDIRNKLSALTGNMYLLKKKTVQTPDSVKYLAEMNKVIEQILKILEFERIYESVGSEELTFVDVEKLFAEATALSNLKDVTVQSDVKGLKVNADSLLRQVMYNFIDNTVKHSKKATLIRLYYSQDAEKLQLIYEDNGEGISPPVKQHLFQMGFGQGTGMGLYMIKRIIDAYGWTIQEKGIIGSGVRFVITINKQNFSLST